MGCCENCKAPCATDFKKVINLQNSGLAIYVHTKKDEQKKAGASKYDETFILHNTSRKQIQNLEYIGELRRFKTKCSQCKTIIQRVRSLLDEARAVGNNEIVGVCEHCKRANLNKTCKRCELIVSKFISMLERRDEERQQQFKVWLGKVKQLLQVTLNEESVCQHRIPYKDNELERILHEIKEPRYIREPDIDFFPSLDQEQQTSLKSLSENKEKLEKLPPKIKLEDVKSVSSYDSLYLSPSMETSMCKYLKERHFELEASGSGTGKSKEFKDIVLSRDLLKDFSKLLSQNKNLTRRLLALSKSLPHSLYLNKELIQKIVETLNSAIKEELPTNMVFKLINVFKELNKTLTHDLSKDLNKEVTQGLINNLNISLKMGSENLNKHLIKLLVDLSDLFTHELSKSMNKEQSHLLSRSKRKDFTQILPNSTYKNITQVLPKTIIMDGLEGSLTSSSEEILRKSLVSQNRRQNVPTIQSQEIIEKSFKRPSIIKIKQETPKGKDDTQGLLRGQSKEGLRKVQSEKSTQGLPKAQSKVSTPISPKGLSKDGMQGIPTDQSKDDEQDLFRGRSKTSMQVLLKAQSKDAMQDIPTYQIKDNEQDLSRGPSKTSKQGFLKTQSKSSTYSLPKGLSKDSTQSLAKERSKDDMQRLPKGQTKDGMQDIPTDYEQDLSREQSKTSKLGFLKAQSKSSTYRLPKRLSKDSMQGMPTDQSKDGERNLSRGQSKDGTQSLPQAQSKEGMQDIPTDQSKTSMQVLLKVQTKDAMQVIPTYQIKDDEQDLSRGQSKKSMQVLVKAQSKDSTQSLPKERSKDGMQGLLKAQSKDSTQGLPKRQSKDGMQDIPIDDEQDLSRGPSKTSKQGFLKTQSKSSTYGLPKGLSKDSLQGIPTDQSKDGERNLSRGQNKQSMQGLLKAQSKYGAQSLPQVQSKVGMQDIPTDQSKTSMQVLLKVQTKDAMQVIPTDQIKDDEQDLSRGQSKKSMQVLVKAQSKDGTQGLPKGQSKDGMQDIPMDDEQDLSRGPSKTNKQGFIKIQSKSSTYGLPKGLSKDSMQGILTDQSKDGERNLSRGQDKQSMQGLLKAQSKDRPQSLPQVQSKEGMQDIPTDQSKTSMQVLLKVETKDAMQVIPTDQIIDDEQDLSRGQSKKSMQVLVKAQSKDGTQGLPKGQSKDGMQDIPMDDEQDLSRGPSKTSKQGFIKIQSKSSTYGLPKGLSKDDMPGILTDQSKDGERNLSRDQTKQSMQSLLKAQSKGGTQNLPQVQSKEGMQDIPTNQSKTGMQVLLKVQTKDAMQVIPTDQIKDDEQDLSLDKSCLSCVVCLSCERSLSRGQNKQSMQGLHKEQSKDGTKDKEDDSPKTPSKGKEGKSQVSPKDITKEHKDKKSESPESKDLSKFKIKNRLQNLIDLNKVSKDDAQKDGRKSFKFKLSDTTEPETLVYKKGIKKSLIGKIESASEEDRSKSGRSVSKKSSTIDRISRKTRSEKSSDKAKAKVPFKEINDTETEFEKSTSSKNKENKLKAVKIKGKVNLPPEDENKTHDLKSKSRQKLTSAQLRKDKQVSHMLGRMLSSDNIKEQTYKFYKKQLANETAIKKKRIQELLMKGLSPLPEKIQNITPSPSLETIPKSRILGSGMKRMVAPKFMIRGEAIIPYKPHYKHIEGPKEHEPLLFKTQLQLTDDPIVRHESKHEVDIDYKAKFKDSVIKYQLSNKEFINKGWTKLPTKKIMRKMNIYRMEPANPQNNWFERHKDDKELFYDSGDKLADIDNNGRGHWYYPNGAIALEYYNAQESNIGRRYIVYSSGTEMDCGKRKPRTILALFDFLGNGVVYDHYGNVRLKYNQSEGVVVDPKLGPPGRWKWHTLNDPPVLKQVFLNSYLKERDPNLDYIPKPEKGQDAIKVLRNPHPEMLAIELDNFVKEKTSKLKQKFTPFQIRMKAVKLNKQFSLKILNQANIYLLYRDGATSLKLDLGMLLISKEIIDTDTSDMADVATPYDRLPAKTHSMENIQKILQSVRAGKLRLPSDLTAQFPR